MSRSVSELSSYQIIPQVGYCHLQILLSETHSPPLAFLKCFGKSCSQRNSFRFDLAFLMVLGDPEPPTLRPFNTPWHLGSQCILEGWAFQARRVMSCPPASSSASFSTTPPNTFLLTVILKFHLLKMSHLPHALGLLAFFFFFFKICERNAL